MGYSLQSAYRVESVRGTRGDVVAVKKIRAHAKEELEVSEEAKVNKLVPRFLIYVQGLFLLPLVLYLTRAVTWVLQRSIASLLFLVKQQELL